MVLGPMFAVGFDALLPMLRVTDPMVEMILEDRRLDALGQADLTGDTFLDVGVISRITQFWDV